MFHELKQGCSGLLEFLLAEKVPLRFPGGLFFICIGINEKKAQTGSLWGAADAVLFVFLFRHAPKDFAVKCRVTESTWHRAVFPRVNS